MTSTSLTDEDRALIAQLLGSAAITRQMAEFLTMRFEQTAALLSAARDEGRAEGLGGEWRPEVVAFADLMEAKLRENDHKGGWKTEDAEDLFGRLGAECVELSEAIGLWRIQDDWRSAALHLPACRKNVAREAADVANFAMMIADVCGALPAPPASQTKEG